MVCADAGRHTADSEMNKSLCTLKELAVLCRNKNFVRTITVQSRKYYKEILHIWIYSAKSYWVSMWAGYCLRYWRSHSEQYGQYPWDHEVFSWWFLVHCFFSRSNVHTNPLGESVSYWNTDFNSVDLGSVLTFCISHRLLGDTDAAGSWTTVWAARF